MNFKIIMLGLSITMLSGCAEMQQQWINDNCNPSGAYSAGMSDGLSPGRSPQRNFANACPENQSALNDSYMSGFTQGLQKRPEQININNNVNVNKHTEKSKAPSEPFNFHADSDRIQRENDAMRIESAKVMADAQKTMTAIANTQKSAQGF